MSNRQMHALLRSSSSQSARFAKWRTVIYISDTLPSHACISANAHALAQYAALCQERSLVPIVEPEVLMDGSHSIERCEEVTGAVLHAIFSALHDQRVWLRRMLLKPNMVVAGKLASSGVSSGRSLPPHCATCVATSLRQCLVSCFCRAARTIGRLRSLRPRASGPRAGDVAWPKGELSRGSARAASARPL
jgi:Fructose-bisphosphate aldolase class-I